jgi:hypothetical protein
MTTDKMLWCIRDEAIRERLIDFIKEVPRGAWVEVLTSEPTRTAQQNSTLHMWCADFIADGEFKTPDGAPYSLLMMKEEFKEAYLPKKTWTNRKGVVKAFPLSTKDLDVTTFSDFLNKIYLASSSLNIRLRDPALNGLEIKWKK